jgi:hypothetical protein
MVILLVALVVVCALGFVVQFGRSFWARARSAERHRQALDTLAGITKGEAPTPAPAPDHDHQAHVRLLGPAGEGPLSRALPPPKALSPSQHATSSPLRRPSRSAQGRAHQHEHSQAPPTMSPANQEPEDEPTRVIPQLILPPPPRLAPTQAQPVAHAHVFYFDDISPLSSSLAAPQPAGTPSNQASFDRPEPQGTDRERRVAAHALVAAAVALIVAGGAVYVALASHKSPAGLASGPGTATTRPAQGPSRSTTPSSAASTTPATSGTPSTTATTQPTTSTHPRPVELISAVGGTDTYQLTSRTASIVVTARGPCWVEVRAGSPAGQVVTEETLEAGQQAKVTGPAWIRLGDPPNASVTVDGTPTTVPGAQSGVPLNLDFTVS